MITRKYPESEITRDPIYLLQSRQIIMLESQKMRNGTEKTGLKAIPNLKIFRY